MNKKITLFFAVTLTASAAISASGYASDYGVDAAHSNVNFTVSHMFSKITGEFKDYEGTFKFDETSKELSDVNFTIKSASISTNNQKRDDHLKSSEFLDTTKFDKLTFVQKKTVKIQKKGKLEGDLTIHGVTKPVKFDVEYLGTDKDPWGNTAASFAATTKVNRKDYGIVFNKMLDSGRFMLGDEVTVTLQVESNPKK